MVPTPGDPTTTPTLSRFETRPGCGTGIGGDRLDSHTSSLQFLPFSLVRKGFIVFLNTSVRETVPTVPTSTSSEKRKGETEPPPPLPESV